MIKLIAFDWNGTLLSDTNTCLKAENKAFSLVSFPQISLLKFKKHFDIPITKFWQALGLNENFFRKNFFIINKEFHKTYEQLANHTRTRSNVKNILQYLEKEKIASVIYSNHNYPNIKRQLIRLKIDKYIKQILARQPNDHSQIFKRYKAEMLHEYLLSKKIKPRQVISVGDTEEEIQIGKEYGYHTVAITGGYNTEARLKKLKPDFLIHNMLELKKIITKLNS